MEALKALRAELVVATAELSRAEGRRCELMRKIEMMVAVGRDTERAARIIHLVGVRNKKGPKLCFVVPHGYPLSTKTAAVLFDTCTETESAIRRESADFSATTDEYGNVTNLEINLDLAMTWTADAIRARESHIEILDLSKYACHFCTILSPEEWTEWYEVGQTQKLDDCGGYWAQDYVVEHVDSYDSGDRYGTISGWLPLKFDIYIQDDDSPDASDASETGDTSEEV